MVARHTDHVTRLGERLDTLFDALGLLTAVLAGIALNQLPLSYLAVALAYYVYSAGIRVRRRTGRMVIPLKPRPAARLIAGFNMGFVATALLPILSPAGHDNWGHGFYGTFVVRLSPGLAGGQRSS